MTPKEYAANLLAEVKLAEKRLEKAKERFDPLAERIKAALRAGDRPAAEKMALAYEQAKDEVARAEGDVAAAKEAFEAGKKRAAQAEQSARTLKNAQALGGALGAINAAMDTANAAEDMLKKLEEDAALADAKLDLLLQDAEEKLPPELRGPSGPSSKGAPPPPPLNTAEDILKEFE
jgi:DNA repair exonuclease SbcCD ATPase subunit